MKLLQGKTTLVTDAIQGIGESIARTFVASGTFVYISDIDDTLGQGAATSLEKSTAYLHLDVHEESELTADYRIK